MKQPIANELRTNFVGFLLLFFVLSLLQGCKCTEVKKLATIHEVNLQFDKLAKISLVLENSASMEPYYKSSGFQTNVSNFISNLDDIAKKQEFLLSDQNAIFFPFASDPQTASSNIQSGFQIAGNSPLDKILNNLIIKSIKENSVMVLVTDLIIDDPKLDGANELNTLQARVKTMFSEANRNNLAAIIYRFETSYSGKYFSSKRSISYDIDQVRPYFFWVIGPSEMVTQFGAKFEESYKKDLNAVYAGIKPRFGVPFLFEYSGAKGCSLKMDYSKDTTKVLGYQIIQRGDSLEFCFGLDMSPIPRGLFKGTNGVKNLLRIETKMARISTRYQDQNSFLKGKDIKEKDREFAGKLGHFFIVGVADIQKSISYTLELKTNLTPANNFSQFSISDDTDKTELLNKTFGLTEFINGMIGAYETSNSKILATIKIN